MAQACSVCSHPQRAEIDLALANGSAVKRRISSALGLTDRSLYRHEKNHLDPALIAANTASKEELAREAISHCRWLVDKARERAEKILARAGKTDGVVCPSCGQRPEPFKEWIDPLNRAITSLGKFTGELANDSAGDVLRELGLRSITEGQRRLEITEGMDRAPLEQVQEKAIEALQKVWRRKPELRQDALTALQGLSYAQVTNGDTNGHSE